jgi:hypothetical protein
VNATFLPLTGRPKSSPIGVQSNRSRLAMRGGVRHQEIDIEAKIGDRPKIAFQHGTIA